MYKLEIYSSDNCAYCDMAKRVLTNKDIDYREYDVTQDAALANEMRQRSNRTSVPQIFLNDKHIGGFDDMMRSIRDGTFTQMLNVVTL